MNAERTPAKGDGSPGGQGGEPGEGFDWGRLGQRSDRRTREGRPRLDGGGEAERDLRVYALALRLTMRLYRPLALAGRVINYLVAVAFLAATVWGASMLVEHGREPVDVLEARVLTRDARPGGTIDVRFDINRRKVCQVNPDYAIIGHDAQGNDNRKFAFAAQHLDIGGPLGHDPFVRSFTLPRELVAGEARFRVGWSWVCPLNFVDLLFLRQSDVKDVPFIIHPAS